MSTERTSYREEQGAGTYGEPAGFGWRPTPRAAKPKPFYLTSEFLTMLATITAVVLAAAVSDDFGAARAWTLVTVLAAAYIVSRGLSKIARGDDSLDRG